MNPTIITVAPTGTLSPKAVNPNVPVTPKEIAEDTYRCWKAGASIVHLHMRDAQDKGTMDKELFKETVQRIRDKCDIIINLTSSGEPGASDERRTEHIAEIKPEMATFDAGSFNWIGMNVFMNDFTFLEKLGRTMKECGAKPEFEIFHPGMFDVVKYYTDMGILSQPGHYQFCLGIGGGMKATPENVSYLKSLLPAGSTWSGFGISKDSVNTMLAILAQGGNIRVGLEDTGWYSKGVRADNLMLVERAARIIEASCKTVATPAQARELLGLKPL